MLNCAIKLYDKISAKSNWGQSLALLAARLWIAKIFLASGLVKIKDWDSTIFLFQEEYKVPLLPPEIAAYMGTAAELGLPILLILGLFTPFAAFGLLIMSVVIELFVYPGTMDHYHWMIILGVLITHGSGKLGADYWLLKLLSSRFLKP